MSENTEQNLNNAEAAAEMEALKAQADALGIKYKSNITAKTLSERIAEATAETEKEAEEAPLDVNAVRLQKKQEQTRLRRVRITCMNPAKREREGDVIKCGNDLVGSLTRYVPFNVEWHVPQMMLNVMKAKVFPQFYTVKLKEGGNTRKHRLVPEYAIEILPELSEAELKALAQRQAMASGTAAAE